MGHIALEAPLVRSRSLGAGRATPSVPVTASIPLAATTRKRPRYTGTTISTTDAGDPTFAYTAKFDIGRDPDMMGSPLRVKFGGLFSSRTKKHEEKLYGATPAQITVFGRPFTFDQIRNFKPYQAELALGYTFNYFSKDAVDRIANEYLKAGILTRIDTNANYFRVQEEILSGYAMGTWDQDWGNMVVGMRVERRKNSGSAFGGVGAANTLLSASTATLNGTYSRAATSPSASTTKT